MPTRLIILSCLVTATTFAADAPKLPAIAASGIEQSERHTSFPEGAIAKTKELLFSDDFERAELGKAWAIVVPTFFHREGRAEGDADAVRFTGGERNIRDGWQAGGEGASGGDRGGRADEGQRD